MNKLLKSAIFITSVISVSLATESNRTIERNSTIVTMETNSTLTEKEKSKKNLEKQIAKEKKFAKEQRFYQGEEFDLSSFEVDKNALDSIPLIEPDYDFDMDDVYD